MKNHHITKLAVIESTDEYLDEVSQNWHPVPAFWVGDYTKNHAHKIRSKP